VLCIRRCGKLRGFSDATEGLFGIMNKGEVFERVGLDGL
jgi:hypothetical protein